MALLDDTTQVLQRLIAPELREINARLDLIERRVSEHELRAEARHNEVLATLQQLRQTLTAPRERRTQAVPGKQLE